jgi:hypothetical protein
MTDGVQSSEWSTFVAHPAAYAHRTRLVACFGDKLSADLCGRLLAVRRLQERLSGLLRTHYTLAPAIHGAALFDADRAIALSSVERLNHIARRCGAIFWAHGIANVVLAPQVAALYRLVGEEICTFALANRDLSGPAQTFDSLEALDARLGADGLRCLGAWCHAQPAGLGARVRLKLMPNPDLDGPPEDPFATIGPAIVHRAAA